jgi:hypothetical protein
MERLLDSSSFIGLAAQQVQRFIDVEVQPALLRYSNDLSSASELTV